MTAVRGILLAAVVLGGGLIIATSASAAGSQIVGIGGKCLDDAASSTTDGNPIVLWSCSGGANQSYTRPGDGTVQVLGKCLDVNGGAKTRGTLVQLWTCNGTGAQQWTVSGSALVNPQSGLCLDATGESSANGTRIEVWTCGAGKANQTWQLSGTAAVATTTAKATTAASTTVASTAFSAAPGVSGGRTRDFFDDFTTTLGSSWGKYGYGTQAPGGGAMGLYSLANVFTSSGNLVLRTQYANSAWSSAGVSSGNGFSAVQGEWDVRARFDKAKGVGFVFLLYPSDGSWPPEVDIAEGRVNGPSVMSVLHWSSANQQTQNFNSVPDMTAWHTYGVIMANNTMTYTLDGKAWASYSTANLPTKKMWIGFQTGAMSCPSTYECIAGNVPNADTPATSNVYIDWVAHYAN